MRERVERRDHLGRIEWLNYRDPQVQSRTPYSFQQLDAEMHTRRIADGSWSAGYKAWLEVMRVLPRWRYLTPLLSVWPFTSLGRFFYRQLATRRYKLFGVPPPCDPNGVCSLHKNSGQ
jgi:predicted DCC family thiol-disulfide oxidoreductase YuxK